MTVQSAAESLGLKWAVIDNLARRGLLALEPGGISVAEVERFRREYVLGSRLAHSMRTSPRHIAKLLWRERSDPGCWTRSGRIQAERL